jgi:DNA modification methylase
MSVQVLTGDCRETLKTLPDGSVHCCVTSPPYFGLRDYGHDGQIGLEQTPTEFVEQLVSVFREVKRVLRDDGTLWLNLGDSYANDTFGRGGDSKKQISNRGTEHTLTEAQRYRGIPSGCKRKDLIGIPWRVAFALQADGWYLRQDIIWHKPNPMPESVTDRCTKAHEYIFLLSKSPKYFFDADAIKEHATSGLAGTVRKDQPRKMNATPLYQSNRGGRTQEPMKQGAMGIAEDGMRNRRSVWNINTKPYRGAHFATFPPDLIRPCIVAGCPASGTVLDPFGGSGTTGQVAMEEGRNAILCELNPEYVNLIDQRLGEVTPSLWSSVSEAESEPLLFAAQ